MTDESRDVTTRRDTDDGIIESDAGAEASEAGAADTSTGNASENIADSPNNAGALRPAPEISQAEEAASQESRRLAEAQDTEL